MRCQVSPSSLQQTLRPARPGSLHCTVYSLYSAFRSNQTLHLLIMYTDNTFFYIIDKQAANKKYDHLTKEAQWKINACEILCEIRWNRFSRRHYRYITPWIHFMALYCEMDCIDLNIMLAFQWVNNWGVSTCVCMWECGSVWIFALRGFGEELIVADPNTLLINV